MVDGWLTYDNLRMARWQLTVDIWHWDSFVLRFRIYYLAFWCRRLKTERFKIRKKWRRIWSMSSWDFEDSFFCPRKQSINQSFLEIELRISFPGFITKNRWRRKWHTLLRSPALLTNARYVNNKSDCDKHSSYTQSTSSSKYIIY